MSSLIEFPDPNPPSRPSVDDKGGELDWGENGGDTKIEVGNERCTFLNPLNTNRLAYLFNQVINLGKLCKSRLTQINHIIETMRKNK